MFSIISAITSSGKKSRARLPTRAIVRNMSISRLISRSGIISIEISKTIIPTLSVITLVVMLTASTTSLVLVCERRRRAH